jgi:hypothetical protein
VRPQVVDVDVGQAAEEQFELLLVEERNELGRDELVEAVEEGADLLLNRLGQQELRQKLQVLALRGGR